MTAEERVDRLARRLASTDSDIVRSGTTHQPTLDSAFDSLARAFGIGMTRRRAMVVAGGVIAAGSLLRPTRARAVGECPSGGPKKCTSGGRQVCVPDNLACCSNENCAIACPYPWRDCEAPATCSDAPRMCLDPTAPGYDPAKKLFCSQVVDVPNGCVADGHAPARRGWCCSAADETCGTEFGECACKIPCGSTCCHKSEDCVKLSMFDRGTCLPECRLGWHHDGYDCVCDHGLTCGTRCCPPGTACGTGSTCVKPPTPKKLPSLWDAFTNFGDVANQSSASHGGGGNQRSWAVSKAQAPAPVSGALLALAAVNTQGAAAGVAFSDDHIDKAYRRKVVAARPSPPEVPSGDGLDPRAASALEALLAAEAKGFAQALACATALARARGATGRHNLRTARKHVIAASRFANRAAKALRTVPSLRSRAVAALQSTGATDVVVSAAEVLTFQDSVRSGGIPADLQDALKRLGVRGDDLTRARTALLVNSAGGPTLLEPLADPARTRNLQSIASELSRFSRSARRSPITRTKGGPKRYRPQASARVRRRRPQR